MRVCVTFCNQQLTPRLAACVIDVDAVTARWLPLPAEFAPGASGIATFQGGLLVACQRGGVARFGPELESCGFIATPQARGLHTIAVGERDGRLYVTSALTDSVIRYRFDDATGGLGDPEIVLCVDPELRDEDHFHVNSIVEWRDDFYVSMFGSTTGVDHRDRKNGLVVRVSDGERVAEGLYHPHSLFVHQDALFVIESQARLLRRIAGGRESQWDIAGGYPRGVTTATDGRLWIGTSALRTRSMSRGTVNAVDGTSTAVDRMTRLVELDLDVGLTGREIDLSGLAGEVFDVRVVEDAVPMPPIDGVLRERVHALEAHAAVVSDEASAALTGSQRERSNSRVRDAVRSARHHLGRWSTPVRRSARRTR